MEDTEWQPSGYSPKEKQEHSPYFHDLESVPGMDKDHTEREGASGRKGANFTEQDQLFLHQIEQNLYDVTSVGENVYENGNSNGQYDFGVDQLNFVLPEEVPFGQQSTAFPPTGLENGINTPTMGPRSVDKRSGVTSEKPTAFFSPILPGQNEKSYNEQHFYHKHQKHHSSEQPTLSYKPRNQHVKPEVVFTPLVSPATTPLDSQVSVGLGKFSQPLQATFEPLTSPALNAQQSERRRSSSNAFATDGKTTSNTKRRTPHGTPVLLAHNQRTRTSPSLNTRGVKSSGSISFEKLPESSVDRSEEGMLPPLSKKVDVEESNGRPTTMMGFTMDVISENKDGLRLSNGDDDTYLKRNSSVTLHSSANGSSVSSAIENDSPPYTEGSNYHNSNSATGLSNSRHKSEKPATKKASHKLAEQGRRNRMNQAVQELSNLIPKEYHDQVAIPSKATTVELASKYILDLVEQVKKLEEKADHKS